MPNDPVASPPQPRKGVPRSGIRLRTYRDRSGFAQILPASGLHLRGWAAPQKHGRALPRIARAPADYFARSPNFEKAAPWVRFA